MKLPLKQSWSRAALAAVACFTLAGCASLGPGGGHPRANVPSPGFEAPPIGAPPSLPSSDSLTVAPARRVDAAPPAPKSTERATASSSSKKEKDTASSAKKDSDKKSGHAVTVASPAHKSSKVGEASEARKAAKALASESKPKSHVSASADSPRPTPKPAAKRPSPVQLPGGDADEAAAPAAEHEAKAPVAHEAESDEDSAPVDAAMPASKSH